MALTDDGVITIRSYRVCFDLERRIHKVDQWRLPLPYGLPLRGLVYGLVLLTSMFVLSRLPVLGAMLGALHPAVRYIAFPFTGAYLLLRWKVDGRSPHATALSWLRMRLEPRRVVAFRAAPPQGPVTLGVVTVAPDERGARLRRGVIHGPARVVLRYPVRARARGGTLYIRDSGGAPLRRGKHVRVRKGQRVVVG